VPDWDRFPGRATSGRVRMAPRFRPAGSWRRRSGLGRAPAGNRRPRLRPWGFHVRRAKPAGRGGGWAGAAGGGRAGWRWTPFRPHPAAPGRRCSNEGLPRRPGRLPAQAATTSASDGHGRDAAASASCTRRRREPNPRQSRRPAPPARRPRSARWTTPGAPGAQRRQGRCPRVLREVGSGAVKALGDPGGTPALGPALRPVAAPRAHPAGRRGLGRCSPSGGLTWRFRGAGRAVPRT